jgi:hypothetical protein
LTTISKLAAQARVAEARRVRLERLLQITAHDFDLRVLFNQYDTVGKEQITMRADPAGVARSEYRALRGHALHLLGHFLSEAEAVVAAVRRVEASGRPHFVSLWHALEDARMENAMLRRWPGMYRSFEALLPDPARWAVWQQSARVQLEIGLYLYGRQAPAGPLSSAVAEALEAAQPAILRAAQEDTPAASLAAMLQMYPLLAPLLAGDHTPHDRPDPRPATEADPAAAGQEGRDRRTAKALPHIDVNDEPGTVGVLGERHELPDWYRPGSAPWFERGLGDKAVHPTAIRTDAQTILTPDRGEPDAYRELWRQVQRQAGFLATRMTNLLRQDAYLRFAGRFRSGKLRTAKLYKQRLGDFRLFERAVVPERQTACLLLIDESASMKGQGKMAVAAQAAALLGETLAKLEVPLEIIGYTTAEFEAQAAMRLGLRPAHEYRRMRCSPVEHRLYKRFSEPYRLVRSRLTGLQPRCNNWDEDSLLFAFRRLQGRSERNKLLLVISDGQPNGDAEHMIAAVRMIEALGCRVIGVGIGADYVRQIYRQAIVVEDFRQLAEELLRLMARELARAWRAPGLQAA